MAEPEPAPPPVILIGRTDGSFDHGEEDGYSYDDEDDDADGPDADTTLHADVTETGVDVDVDADADADGAMEFAKPGAGSPRRGAREGVQEHPLRQASPPPWGDEDMDDDDFDDGDLGRRRVRRASPERFTYAAGRAARVHEFVSKPRRCVALSLVAVSVLNALT